MTAGTSPAWRSLRAWPVPTVERAFALSETVAILTFLTSTYETSQRNPCASARTLRWLLPPYHPLPASWRATGTYSVKQAADRLLAVGVADRFRDQLTNRKNCQLRGPAGFGHLNGVGHRHFLDRRVGQTLF